jgi:LDH2 family malate/lactate/ureidoglycolate dehydrogenase
MVLIKENLLRHLCNDVFISIGCSECDAKIATDVLVAADLQGIDSHGVSRLKGYVALYDAGRINTTPNIKIIRSKHSICTIDGDGGLGLVVANKAMEISINLCEKYGSGWVAVQNSNHFGISGYHANKATEKDFIGMAMTNATPFVPPVHGKKAMLGTNPLAYSFPTGKEFNLIIDLATAAVARGKLEVAKRENKEIPFGWVLDTNGKPSKDVDVLEKGGLLSPLGSLEELGSHKGYALGSLVDILSAVLSGANYGPWVPPFVSFLPVLENSPGKGLGHFFGAMDIDGFRPKEDFIQHIDHWIDTFKNSERIDNNNPILVPGEPEYLTFKERTNHGVPINNKVAEDLQSLARRFKVNFL